MSGYVDVSWPQIAKNATGRVVQTAYDALNRPESIVEGGRATRYGYDLGGRAVILMAGNGQVSSNTYDALGRLKQRTLYRSQAMGAGDVLTTFDWTHDLLGNVTTQSETWSGDPTRPGTRTTTMAYDANNRLIQEVIQDPTAGITTTAYAYDAANNRSSRQVSGNSESGRWTYAYNEANQLTGWEKRVESTLVKSAAMQYDAAGNRSAQSVSDFGPSGSGSPVVQNTSYAWDAQDRLASVTMPDGKTHEYEYDYRTRRIGTTEGTAPAVPTKSTAIVFAGGLSLAEWETTGSQPSTLNSQPSIEYTRGPDMGGGVGGMLYSIRSLSSQPSTIRYSLSNGRGDIVAQSDQSAALTWTASYEAYGKRTAETGTNLDKQRANSKDEDPTGLLNEGFRYRDLETGVWLSRDPAGFVDGPNLYAYVKQNPWTAFDPDGLAEKKPGVFKRLWNNVKDAFKKKDAKGSQEKQPEVSDSSKRRQEMAEALVKTGGHGTAEDEKAVEKELSKLSEKRLQEMQDKGVDVIACRDSVTDHWTHLKGVQPRGWPAGKTWDNVPGAQGGKEVVVATTGTGNKRRVPATGEGHGSVNMTLHESGHSLESEGHNSNDFKNARQADLPKMGPYYHQAGHAGVSETFAEGFAHYYDNSSRMSRQLPNLFKYYDKKENPSP